VLGDEWRCCRRHARPRSLLSKPRCIGGETCVWSNATCVYTPYFPSGPLTTDNRARSHLDEASAIHARQVGSKAQSYINAAVFCNAGANFFVAQDLEPDRESCHRTRTVLLPERGRRCCYSRHSNAQGALEVNEPVHAPENWRADETASQQRAPRPSRPTTLGRGGARADREGCRRGRRLPQLRCSCCGCRACFLRRTSPA
jgi:hypothetical protein